MSIFRRRRRPARHASQTVFSTRLMAAEHRSPGEQVCATLLSDGTPVYFLMPALACDDDVRSRAFEIREGRPMDEPEKRFVEAVNAYRSKLDVG